MNMLGIDHAIFRNCISIETRETGIVPVRFTKAQFEEYAKSDGTRVRSYNPASVCIDVMTDASCLTLKFIVEGIVRPYGFLDLLIDNGEIESFWFQPVEQKMYSMDIPLNAKTGGVRRVTVYLPHNLGMIITHLAWSGGDKVEPAPSYEKNMLCLGDSITQGATALHPSNAYPTLLSRHLRMNVLNQGVGGYIFEEASLDSQLTFTPDYITVAYGTNDWGRDDDLDTFENKVTAYITRLAMIFPHATIYVITPVWRKDIDELKKMGTFGDMVNAIEEACSSWSSIQVIHGMDLIPHNSFFFSDGVHPTDEGFKMMARNLVKRITDKS